MKKLMSTITVLALSMFFVSCGSSVSCPTPAPAVAVVVKTLGSVSDGPIYNANVKIETLDGKLLGETKTDSNGHYEVDIKDLPTVYRVRISGGTDKGVDSEKNANDENNSLEMSAIVTRDSDSNETNESVGHVTPATTLVNSIVEDGALPSESVEDVVKRAVDAQKTVNDSFGLPEKTDLSKLDPAKDEVANRLGNLIALITKSIPQVEEKVVFKSVTKMVIKKKLTIKVSALDVSIDDLNLSEIATDAGASDENIERLKRVETVVKTQITKVVKTTKVSTFISKSEKEEAVSAKSALVELLKEIKSKEIDELDINKLTSLVTSLENAVKNILVGINLNTSSPDDIDFIGALVRNNLDENTSLLIDALQGYQKVVQKTTSIKVKKVVKYTYLNSKASQIEKLADKLDNSLDDFKAIDGFDGGNDEVNDILADMFGAKVAQNIENGDANITGAINETINNIELVQTIKTKIQTKTTIKDKKFEDRTSEDKVKLIAVKKVIHDIKINIKVEKFTSVSVTNVDNMFNTIVTDLEDNIENLLERIEALDLQVVNLHKEFSSTTFISTQTTIIQTINNIDKKYDKVKTINNLYIKTVEKFVESKGEDELNFEDENLLDEVKVELPPRIITLPMPTLKSMPEFLTTPIKVAI